MTSVKDEHPTGPNDHHLGKYIYWGLSSQPDLVSQIDGVTDERETNESVLQRSLRLTNAMRNHGIVTGDTVAIVSRHHLDVCISIYASMFLGVAIQPCDVNLSDEEMKHALRISAPKVVFCQHEYAVRLSQLQAELGFELVTYGDEKGYQTIGQFMKNNCTDKTSSIRMSMPNIHGCLFFDDSIAEFDPSETIAFLASTSGTTGNPKLIMITHKNIVQQFITMQWVRLSSASTQPITRTAEYIGMMMLVISPLQWLTGALMYVNSAIACLTRLQTSNALTIDLINRMIQQYKPIMTAANPGITKTLLDSNKASHFSCFKSWTITGSTVPKEVFAKAKSVLGQAANVVYGATEFSGSVFRPSHDPETEGVGSPNPNIEYRLMDIDTGSEVKTVGEVGELWIKSAIVAKGYLNDPEATKEVFMADGWVKSGDLFYRDANGFFHFVERTKLLIKYYSNSRAQYMAPSELEIVIRQLDGVEDVAVTGVENPAGGELPAGVVVKKPGSNLVAEQVMQKIKDNLPEMKHLHGGVVFVDCLPRNASGKVNQREIKKIASTSETIRKNQRSGEDISQQQQSSSSRTTSKSARGSCCLI